MDKLLLECVCGHRMQVPGDSLGRSAKCTKCGNVIQIGEQNARPVDGANPKAQATAMRKRIGDLLVEAGLITRHQLHEGLTLQQSKGGKLAQVLISLDYIDLPTFVDFLARQPGVASIDLLNYQIADELIELVPRELAIKHEVFPIDKMGKHLTLGMACPLDSAAINDIETATGLRVKALLVPQNDLRAALDRYYPEDHYQEPAKFPNVRERSAAKIESSLKMGQVGDLVRRIDGLPALPDTVHRIREVMDDINTSVAEVAGMVGGDPALAAKVLSVANSAAYGFSNRVDDLNLAVALMGLKETYSIVLSAAVIDLFDKSKNFDYAAFWADASNCAQAALIVAKTAGEDKQSGFFSAGLLHDIGRLALLEAVPKRYAKIPGDAIGLELIDHEERLVGLSHTEAGYVLAEHWNFPPDLADPIRGHHASEFTGDAARHTAAVAIADRITRCSPSDGAEKERVLEECANGFAVLGLESQAAGNLFDEIAKIDRSDAPWSAGVHPAERT